MKSTKKILHSAFLLLLLFILESKANAQLQFIQNKGQWNSKVQFKSDFNSGAFFLEKNGFTVLLHNAADLKKMVASKHVINTKTVTNNKDSIHSNAYKVKFVGGNDNPVLLPEKIQTSYNNYFIGNDKTKWAGFCKIYNAVTYKNIYPNIDVRYYANGDKLKYDFIVHPGGNPKDIALRYEGAKQVSVKNNELIIATSIGNLKELVPYTYQPILNSSKNIECSYFVKNNVVSFKLEKYNKNEILIIDPQLIFSSFTGSTADNWGYTATPGPDGSFFAGGITFNNGFPVSPGAFQTAFNGGEYDISILKFSPNGTQRLYATYIGGDKEEQPHSMIADAAGNLIVMGRSNSSNYPLLTNIPANGSNYDIVVTKLNVTGSAIIGSARIGGSGNDGINIKDKENTVGATGDTSLRRNYGDDARSEVILDAANNVVIVACTQSIDFPTVAAFQPVLGGGQDGVIVKLTPNLSSIIFSTYFGGSLDDGCFVAAINPITNNLYVGGATKSSNLPGNTVGTINPNYLGNIDGFVTEILADGSAIMNTTYIGTPEVDLVYGLKFDKVGFPYIMGTTTGTWTAMNAFYNVPNSKQFIAKLLPDLSAFVYSTNFGTVVPTPNISPIAFLVDRCENVYVSGWGGNVNGGYSNSGTSGLSEVNPLAGIPPADGSDFYFFVLKKNAQAQLFGSHFGQNGGVGDHVDGGTSRFDDNGIIYQAMCANCGKVYYPSVNFPTYPTGPTFPYSSTNNSSNCNLAAVKINMNFAGVATTIQSSIAGVLNDTLGCVPIIVSFKDTLQKGVTYYWNFDAVNFPNAVDAITTHPDTSHLFTVVGIYKVRLIAEDLTTCNLRDTSYITINIADNRVTPSFIATRSLPCNTNKYTFENTSQTANGAAFVANSFVWDYGDGSPKDTTNKLPNRAHTYASLGTYFVTLTVIDPRFCNAPETDTVKIIVGPNVKAIIDTLFSKCAPSPVILKNNSLFGITWLWQIIDNNGNIVFTSNQFEPNYTFTTGGLYKYRLIAYNPNTCNLSDTSAYKSVQIEVVPIALFNYTPIPPQPNTAVRFINLSSNATNYLWDFGDGQTAVLFEPIHEYNKTGNYNITLIAYNNQICADTFRLIVNVIIDPLLDVPNAFTPGKFGSNGIVYVRGFGIGKMEWKIYNRWGELVFKSNNKTDGWDGFYKGKLQAMDVYTYTLDVEFVDGQKVKKTGDISLLR